MLFHCLGHNRLQWHDGMVEDSGLPTSGGTACRLLPAEIIKDHAALTYQLKPRDLEEAAQQACSLKASEIHTVFPDVRLSDPICVILLHTPFLCMAKCISHCHISLCTACVTAMPADVPNAGLVNALW